MNCSWICMTSWWALYYPWLPSTTDPFTSEHILHNQHYLNSCYPSGTSQKIFMGGESWVRVFLSKIPRFHMLSPSCVPKFVFVYMGREKEKQGQQVMIYTPIKVINLWHFSAYAPKFFMVLYISKLQICQGQLLPHIKFGCSGFLGLPGSLCVSVCWWRTRTFAVW